MENEVPMLADTLVNDTLTQKMTLIRLKSNVLELGILHIGQISSLLTAYFSNSDIQYQPVNSTLEHEDVDMVLINDNPDVPPAGSLLKGIRNLKPVVTYMEAFYSRPKAGYIHTSLIPVLISYLFKIKEAVIFQNTKKTRNNVFLKQVNKVIEEHIDDHTLSMKKLSDLLYMSRSSFSKKIKSYTGLKPTEYINRYKLNKSKHLLVITNWQISRIADVLGFSSQHYYCRLFKRQEGVSPSKYRYDNQYGL
ncbi:helix-turn-helix transcriptional regulator [Sinomicrobium weinanense]|uniref:Helix-turn-helix transcriptional regulator n=1 Tax=Sinomicrobium weinanense TaxID=2842200 RepID=A0A926JPA7_9FLAO|nr:helix-turn-helix transcriptional regulator [Sinomicrobium weinanense]MBC9794787.1 helix-turn-helix transcriptional regulator [Sinomicrobium weinanense]MBU3125046.1 helix-turn-helix transcriptional regulator [Sinomicrobium weinanense]